MSAPARSEQTSGAGNNRRCYVYGIVPQDVEVTADARGVGDPPGQVKLLRHGDIAALVSDIDVTQPLGRPEDLMDHQQLLDAASAETPVLPLRFGAVMTNSQAVVDELLGPHHDEFAAALKKLEGRAEYVVKGRYVEKAVLKEVLSENAEAAGLRDEIRAGDEYATRNARIRLGEIINQAITAKREADTRKVGDVLAPYCVASNVREPTHEQDAAHLALLVATAEEAEFERAVDELAYEWDGRVNLRLLGPMAPYDFVTATAPGG